MPLSLDALHRLRPQIGSLLRKRGTCWLNLSPDRITLQQAHSGTSWQTRPDTHQPWDLHAALTAWDTLWQGLSLQHQQLRVVLSDQWAHGMAMAIPEGMQKEQDIRQFALAEFKQRFGEGIGPCHIDWTVFNRSVLALACPDMLMDRLRQSLDQTQSQLDFLSTQSLESMRLVHQTPPSDRWFVVVGQHNVTFMCLHQSKFAGYWVHPRLGPIEQDLLVSLERHQRLMGIEKGMLEIIDPLQYVPTMFLESALQTAGWEVEISTLRSTKSQGIKASSWEQFVGQNFR